MGNTLPMPLIKNPKRFSKNKYATLNRHAYNQNYQGFLQNIQKHSKKQGLIVTHKSPYLNTALHILCGWGNSTPLECILAFILLYPESVILKNKGGYTPLHIGLWWGLTEGAIDLLLCADTYNASIKTKEYFSVLDTVDGYGRTPLHMAAVSPHNHSINVYKSLLERYSTGTIAGGRVLIPDAMGRTPLELFCKRHNSNLETMLLNPKVTDGGETWEIISIMLRIAYYTGPHENAIEQIECPTQKHIECWHNQHKYSSGPFLNVNQENWKTVHAALALYARNACSELIARLALKFHEEEIFDVDIFGNLPLHTILKNWSTSTYPASEGELEEFVHILLLMYPNGTRLRNPQKKLPLECAVQAHATLSRDGSRDTTKLGMVIRSILKRYPEAIATVPNIGVELYPYLLAQVGRNETRVDTVFRILRGDPGLIG